MIDGGRSVDGVVRELTGNLVGAYKSISKETVQKALKKGHS